MSSDEEGQHGRRGKASLGNVIGTSIYPVGSNVVISRGGENVNATIIQYDQANRVYWVRLAGANQPVQVLDTQVVGRAP
ncbi:hypothetical protein BDV93DRAFT_522701 [Ceratobasidium sp. AG-I]|nr:hypothetical protein BDV93DRAFT_522701 [Ceratobasidium sp. AG-I]